MVDSLAIVAAVDSLIDEKIEKGRVGFKELEAYALSNGEPTLDSGRQEFLENLINEFV
jgi:xylose isomerase